eukprot:jgi/Chlat1/860/Chrsp106S01315
MTVGAAVPAASSASVASASAPSSSASSCAHGQLSAVRRLPSASSAIGGRRLVCRRPASLPPRQTATVPRCAVQEDVEKEKKTRENKERENGQRFLKLGATFMPFLFKNGTAQASEDSYSNENFRCEGPPASVFGSEPDSSTVGASGSAFGAAAGNGSKAPSSASQTAPPVETMSSAGSFSSNFGRSEPAKDEDLKFIQAEKDSKAEAGSSVSVASVAEKATAFIPEPVKEAANKVVASAQSVAQPVKEAATQVVTGSQSVVQPVKEAATQALSGAQSVAQPVKEAATQALSGAQSVVQPVKEAATQAVSGAQKAAQTPFNAFKQSISFPGSNPSVSSPSFGGLNLPNGGGVGGLLVTGALAASVLLRSRNNAKLMAEADEVRKQLAAALESVEQLEFQQQELYKSKEDDAKAAEAALAAAADGAEAQRMAMEKKVDAERYMVDAYKKDLLRTRTQRANLEALVTSTESTNQSLQKDKSQLMQTTANLSTKAYSLEKSLQQTNQELTRKQRNNTTLEKELIMKNKDILRARALQLELQQAREAEVRAAAAAKAAAARSMQMQKAALERKLTSEQSQVDAYKKDLLKTRSQRASMEATMAASAVKFAEAQREADWTMRAQQMAFEKKVEAEKKVAELFKSDLMKTRSQRASLEALVSSTHTINKTLLKEQNRLVQTTAELKEKTMALERLLSQTSQDLTRKARSAMTLEKELQLKNRDILKARTIQLDIAKEKDVEVARVRVAAHAAAQNAAAQRAVLERKLQAESSLVEVYKKDLLKTRSQRASLEADVNSSLSNFSALMKERNKLAATNAEFSQRTFAIERQMNQVNAELVRKLRSLDTVEKELALKNKDILKARTQSTTLVAEAKVKDATLASLQAEKSKLESSLADLRATSLSLTGQVKQLQTVCHNQRRNLEALDKELTLKNRDILKTRSNLEHTRSAANQAKSAIAASQSQMAKLTQALESQMSSNDQGVADTIESLGYTQDDIMQVISSDGLHSGAASLVEELMDKARQAKTSQIAAEQQLREARSQLVTEHRNIQEFLRRVLALEQELATQKSAATTSVESVHASELELVHELNAAMKAVEDSMPFLKEEAAPAPAGTNGVSTNGTSSQELETPAKKPRARRSKAQETVLNINGLEETVRSLSTPRRRKTSGVDGDDAEKKPAPRRRSRKANTPEPMPGFTPGYAM